MFCLRDFSVKKDAAAAAKLAKKQEQRKDLKKCDCEMMLDVGNEPNDLRSDNRS